ncbi:MAG: anthranilate phosphoribosyltransferase [Planctomycetaceae bacterium]|nr:anthranilate phosphoribosyltransferase [Planctomycetaceae bacterium]
MTAPDPVLHAVHRALDGHPLSEGEMRAAVSAIMDGQSNEVAIAAFLTALRAKGEVAAELVGAARAMRERATRIPTSRTGLLDTCGTGGDRLHTFNISTAAAIVVAAAGVPVAKHGNRSVSSTSGSADVLESLGVMINLSAIQVGRCVDEIGLGFCFAPLLHGAMRHVGPVRRQLGFRTIFNLLGPLTNPAGAEFQLIGTHDPGMASRMAEALSQLGSGRAIVVCGADGLDEVSLWGETSVFHVEGNRVRSETWTAETLGLPACAVKDLQVNSPQESADRIRHVVANEAGPCRDIVVANAGAALFVCGQAATPLEGAEKAAAAIAEGRAAQKLRDLVAGTAALSS